jgi:hypothetical protein
METNCVALQGTLDVVSVADVLRLLAATGKTGRLQLENERSRGVIWVHEGHVAALSDVEATVAEPMVEFLFWFSMDGGWFRFDIDDQAPDGDVGEVGAIVAELAALSREWEGLQLVVPSPEHRVRLVTRLPQEKVTLDAERWPAVLAAATGPRVRDLGAELGVAGLEAFRAARELVTVGVAEVLPPPERTRVPSPPVPAANAGSH